MATNVDPNPDSLIDLAMAVENGMTPLDRLVALRALKKALAVAEYAAVEEARAQRLTWGEIAASLEISKQGAQQRYSRPRVPTPGALDPAREPARAKKPSGWDITTRGGRLLFSVVKKR